jgi:hypothetical protein
VAKEIRIGSVIYLKSGVAGAGYLDTYEWVGNVPAFWQVAGSERVFVSTYAKNERDISTKWQIISAQGKANNEPLRVGDSIHLLNLYPDAGFLDACGWVEDLEPFQQYIGKVSCGIFTSGARNRDNGTGIWIVESQSKALGEPLYEDDPIWLKNGHPNAGYLVSYGAVSEVSAFANFEQREQLVFGSRYPELSEARTWGFNLTPQVIVKPQVGLFDYYNPELLKGRSNNMEAVRTMTKIVLRDAFEALADLKTSEVDALLSAKNPQPQKLVPQRIQNNPQYDLTNVVDHEFQVRQLLNLQSLSRTLHSFEQSKLYNTMETVLQNYAQNRQISPLNLVREAFRSVASDYEIIQRAIVQRRWVYNETTNTYYQSNQAEELLVTDKLAFKALTYFKHLLPPENQSQAVITYFSDTTHIRRLPYTQQFLLLGVSYDRISPANTQLDATSLHEPYFSSFELMAIPHEIGHYIYQNGKLSNGQSLLDLSQQFADHAYYRWCEELFADLYGCIVAGPLTVFSMQAFLTSGDIERAWRDDDEHPTPLVRSYILAEMLRVLNEIAPTRYPFKHVCAQLDDEWTNTLDSWSYQRVEPGTGRPTRVYLPGELAYQERILNVERLLKSLRPIIVAFAKALLSSLPAQSSNEFPWSKDDTRDAKTYAQSMVKLTGRETARQTVDSPSISSSQIDELPDLSMLEPVKQLAWYLEHWGDKGPYGWGGH